MSIHQDAIQRATTASEPSCPAPEIPLLVSGSDTDHRADDGGTYPDAVPQSSCVAPTSVTNAAFEEEFDARTASDCGSWDPPPFLSLGFWGISSPKDEPPPPPTDGTPKPSAVVSTPVRRRSWLREPFCGISHLLGAVASAFACLLLLRLAAGQPAYVILGAVLYGVSLIALYTASGLYHSLHGTPRTIALLQRLDHSAIFLLIAGTFAPLCLITLRGVPGWTLLAVESTLTLAGIGMVLYRVPFPAPWRIGLYLFMGWLSVLVLGPLHATLATPGVLWYVSGGLLYSLGTMILATDRPHLWPGRFNAHDLWHLFVIGGSVCHFILIYRYVIPGSVVNA